MRHFHDHNDDEGYFALVITDEPDQAQAFRDWLTGHGIQHTTEWDTEEELGETIYVGPLTDTSRAVLLKMTWGGR